MTSTQDLAATTDTLDVSFQAAGLTLEPADGLADLVGGLSAISFTDGSAGGATPATLAVATDAGLDVFDAAVAAIQKSMPGLSTGEPTALGSVAELDVNRPGIVTHRTILSGGAAVGLVILEQDRRSASPTAETEDAHDSAGAAPNGGMPDEPGAGFLTGPEAATPLGGPNVVSGTPSGAGGNLTMLSDVMLNVTVDLGRQSLSLAQVLALSIGSVVELDRAAGAPVDVRVNGILFGRGEVVVVDDEYAVRIIEILQTPGH